MTGYSDVLRSPGVARIITAQLVARFPNGMASLAIFMHVERITGSYAMAGIVLAATSIGQAISGPVTSRWMGRYGSRPVLMTTILVCTFALGGLTFFHFFVPESATETLPGQVFPAIIPPYIILGLLTGLATPPIQSAVRTIYPKMVNSKQLSPLFALDASLQEIIWIFAPVIIVLVITSFSSVAGLSLIMAILVLGGFWFVFLPEVGRVRIPASRSKLGKVLQKPAVLLSTITGFLLIGACAAVEAAVVGTFGHEGPTTGLVLAVFSIGSLIGGLASGAIPIGPWAMSVRSLVVLIGLSIAPFFVVPGWAGQPWGIGAALVIAGLGVAPLLAVQFAITSASVKFSETAEAFGWMATGQLIGAAAGSAVAGFLLDGTGPRGAFIAAALFAGTSMIVSIVCVRGLPDLRGRDVSPSPDTAPIHTVVSADY